MADRRDVLVGLSASLAAVVLGACGGEDRSRPLPPGAVRIPLADLPDGRRVVTLRVDEPIEVLRSDGVVTARSLYCPHFGCRVAWDDASRRYLCPCHGGAFDASGAPVAGPPTEPLRSLPVERDGDGVVVMPRREKSRIPAH